jgi:hypothetical protein
MADDLFRGRLGAFIAFLTVVIFFGAFYFDDATTRGVIWVIFFFAFGGLNYWNYRITWRYRYLVSAMIFLLGGVAGLINIFFSNMIQWKTIWLVTIILFVLAVPITALLRGLGVWKRNEFDEKI